MRWRRSRFLSSRFRTGKTATLLKAPQSAPEGVSCMSSTLLILAHILLGGAFVVFGIRNIPAIPGLAAFLAGRKVMQPEMAARFGVGLQIVGGALTVLSPFVPVAGVIGGLALIVFLVLATVLFHPFWEFSGEERKPHVQAFIMNSGLTGAFLLVIAHAL